MRNDTEEIFAAVHRFVRLMTRDVGISDALTREALQNWNEQPRASSSNPGRKVELFSHIFHSLVAQFCAQNPSRTAAAAPAANDSAKGGLSIAILERFHQLPFADRAAVALVVVENFTVSEAAQIMNLDKDAVRYHLREGRRALNPDLAHSLNVR